MLNAELRVVSGKQAGNVIPLAAGRFLIGREEDCHLRPGNDLVSRHHCVFKMDEYTVRVRDLGSTNGTFVNGERLRGEVMLNTGDKVRVGTLEFEVVIGEGAAEAEQASATLEGEPDTSQTIIQDEAPTDAPETAEIAAFQGDTVYQPQPQYDPTQQQQQQGYGQPMVGYQMPYPQYPYGQPYGMPMGYPQQPMPYPPMYPQQPMPMPMAPQPTPAPEPAAATDKRTQPPVSLPDPSQTGAKPPAPGGESSGQSSEKAVSSTVNDIIKQYTQRRPGGTGKK
jgi:pSer/pThr/pTyr-binding forkhead associated (FHA) protein